MPPKAKTTTKSSDISEREVAEALTLFRRGLSTLPIPATALATAAIAAASATATAPATAPGATSATATAPAATSPTAPVQPDPPRSSNYSVELRDGTSIDIEALVDARIQSALAYNQALKQKVDDGSGPSGYKRPLDTSVSTHRVDSSKRLRPTMASTVEDQGQGYAPDEDDSSDETHSDEDDEDQFRMSSVFGVGINSDADPCTVEVPGEDARSEVVRQPAPARLTLQDGATAHRPVPESDSRNHIQAGNVKEVEGLEIDKDLYVPPKSSPNWSPAIGLTNWAITYFDREWTIEQVKGYEQSYVAAPEYRHIFTPIPIPKWVDQALNSQYTKDTDKYFNRRETERILFRAARDVCAAYGPIFEALTLLGERGGCERERQLLTEGMLGVSSAMLKITRARRELIRRYFAFETARELYDFSPTHTQFFGGNSLEERVKEAKALAEARRNMFFRPQPKAYNKSAKSSRTYAKAAGFQNQSQQQKPQSSRRGRGRGRRYKNAKNQSASAKTSESK